jgi:hypothetical protein
MATNRRRRIIDSDGAARVTGRRVRLCSIRIGVLLLVASVVFGGAMVVPQMVVPAGYATWQDRTSTAIRAVGLGGALDQFENWFYSRSAPSDTPPDLRSVTDNATRAADPGTLVRFRDLPPLTHTADNAGWHPVVKVPGAPPVVFTAVTQPDPLHRSIVVGVALVRSAAVQAHLMPGTVQPAQSGSPGQIPSGQLPEVAAAFNSGFKMSGYSGGFFLEGTTVRDLIVGKASAVIDDTGHLTVGQWGRDVQMGPHVRAVRQNLALIVDHGGPVSGLDRNTDQRWGNARNQLQYTWRSALGVTSSGDIVYVAGNKLNLATLATALAQVGVVTGMELDIHSGMEFFSSWRSDGGGSAKPHRLLAAMVGPADRYVAPDERDFFYFTTAPTTPAVGSAHIADPPNRDRRP